MTTEDDFQRKLDENPNDWQTRIVFADWLEDRGDERATGYRFMGMRRLRPHSYHITKRWSWGNTETGRSAGGTLKACWWRKLPYTIYTPESHPNANLCWGQRDTTTLTRREAEDNAARAFAELTSAQQATC